MLITHSIYNDYQVIHSRHFPLIITFVAAVGANRALIYTVIPELQQKLDKLKETIEDDNRELEIDQGDH